MSELMNKAAEIYKKLHKEAEREYQKTKDPVMGELMNTREFVAKQLETQAKREGG